MEVLRKVSTRSASYLFITGDFNYLDIDREHLLYPAYAKDFVDLTLDSNWTQVISSPTREKNILDLLFTNAPESVIQVQINEPLGDSDHGMIVASLHLAEASFRLPSESWRFDWRRADWIAYELQLQRFDWDSFYESTDVNVIYDNLLNAIWSAFSSAVPVSRVVRKARPP